MERQIELTRNKLIILKSGFEDPAYPSKAFYCWHCILMEGLIASFPDMASKLDVLRIAWPRPRDTLTKILGPNNQSLPVLILADSPPEGILAKTYNGISFINEKDTILQALSLIYGIPAPHP